MTKDELVGSVVLGAMAALISMLIWGRWLVDLIAAGT
jgi:hypothetical protein